MHQGNLNGQYYIKGSFGLGGKLLLHLKSLFTFSFCIQVSSNSDF